MAEPKRLEMEGSISSLCQGQVKIQEKWAMVRISSGKMCNISFCKMSFPFWICPVETTSIIFPFQKKKKKNLHYFHYSPISENGIAILRYWGVLQFQKKTFGTVVWVTQTHSLMFFLQSLLGVIL